MNTITITDGIRWFMEDSFLDRDPHFDVVTTRQDDRFETIIYGVPAADALAALAEYLDYNPVTAEEHNGLLVVIRPID